MQVGTSPATAGRIAVCQHPYDLVKPLPGHLTVGPRTAEHLEKGVSVPFSCGDLSDDLLGQHVPGRPYQLDGVEFLSLYGIEQRSALHQFVS